MNPQIQCRPIALVFDYGRPVQPEPDPGELQNSETGDALLNSETGESFLNSNQ